MALSLRTRLTVWYSALLLLAIVLFTATVLWLHWRLLVRQADESLETLSAAAANVVAGELDEDSTLMQAAREMESVVGHPDYAVAVLDGSGVPVRTSGAELPLAATEAAPAHNAVTATMTGTARGAVTRTVIGRDGRDWRLTERGAEARGQHFTVAIAAPMAAIVEQWRTLLDACALGIPFVLAIAAAGGWLVGRRGLRPLATMAEQSRDITVRNLDTRLAVPGAGPELEAVAVSFNRVLDRLSGALSTQRRFMADASHELRTPVSIMRTAADVTLSQPTREEPEYRDALSAVAQQSSRLARLVDDMLVLARADAGGYPIRRAELDLDALVDGCVREFAATAAEKAIRLTSHLVPVIITADEALLRRMLGNLLINALTYTPAGGAVDVAMVPRDGALSIHVSDSGPGVAAADRERVFERFVRLDPARGQGGAGLGLAIARWIAEAHGGQVEILRSGPSGSVFAATIPA